MARPQKTLVVNGDDFGLSEGINRGIRSAFLHGILRSASLMPNGLAFDHAVEIASRTPGLGVGVHLSLVAERCVAPVEQVRGLAAPDGSLPPSYAAFTKAFLLRRFGVAEIRAEVEAQIRRVLDTGIKPTHLDSHQHVHVLPGFVDVALEVAKAAGIPVVRVPLDRGGPGPSPATARGAQQFVLSLFARRCKGKANRSGLRSVDHFWGIGVSGNMNEANLAGVLGRLGDGVNEVMCHPGFGDPATEARYPWDYSWDDEAAALQSGNARRIIEDGGIRLAHFGTAWDAVE